MQKSGFKSGFVAIVGRPNVGKSSILNALTGEKISIVSPIPQTTRHQIRSIMNAPQAQAVFVDTPGIHTFADPLASHLNNLANRSLEGCDLILYVVDLSRAPGREERKVLELLVHQDIKVIMALNKLDLNDKSPNEYVQFWKERVGDKRDPLLYFIPCSAQTGKNIEVLKNTIIESLPEGEPFYDSGTVTDFPINFRLADLVREQLFLNLTKELPHSLAVEVEVVAKKEKFTHVKINIYVVRESQKKIVIGRNGEVLKKVGTAARPAMEKILGHKVYLELVVRVLADWQQRPRILKELGYWWA